MDKKIYLLSFTLSFLFCMLVYSSQEKQIMKNNNLSKKIKLKIVDSNKKINYYLTSKENHVFELDNIQLAVKETLGINNPYSFFQIRFLNNKKLLSYKLLIEGKLIDEKIEEVILNNIVHLNQKVNIDNPFIDTMVYVKFIIEELDKRRLNSFELKRILEEIRNVQSSIRVLRDYVHTDEVENFLFKRLEIANNRYINVFSEFIENN